MKPRLVLRPLALSAVLTLVPVGAAFAQTADPSATVAPSKPAAETATPSPSAAVNSSPAPTAAAEDAAAPKKEKLTAEQRAARKKARLEKYDKNKDGKLDASERAAMRADRENNPKAKVSPTP